MTVHFAAVASDADGIVMEYVWTFGDGTFSYNPDGAPDGEPFYSSLNPTKIFWNTGHRIIRLSSEDGSQSSYFHQNKFTPDGTWIVFRSNVFGPAHVFQAEVAKARQ